MLLIFFGLFVASGSSRGAQYFGSLMLMIAVIGIFNSLLWMMFSMAVNLGSIAITIVIISISPVVASLLAYKVLKEKLRRVQFFGMLISSGGTLILV